MKFISLFSITFLLLVSCSSNAVTEGKDREYVKEVRETVTDIYNKQTESLKKFNMSNYLNKIDDSDFINAGKLSCKVIENIKPEENKFDPATMPKVAEDMPYPVAYVKVKQYIDSKLFEPKNDLDYMSLNTTAQFTFSILVPYLLTESVLKHSITYYCPSKKV